MIEGQPSDNSSKSMAILMISALERMSNDSSTWSDPAVHKAILVTGISLLITCIQCIEEDLLD